MHIVHNSNVFKFIIYKYVQPMPIVRKWPSKQKPTILGSFFLLFPVCVQYDGQCVSLQILVIFPIGSWTTPPQDLMVWQWQLARGPNYSALHLKVCLFTESQITSWIWRQPTFSHNAVNKWIGWSSHTIIQSWECSFHVIEWWIFNAWNRISFEWLKYMWIWRIPYNVIYM